MDPLVIVKVSGMDPQKEFSCKLILNKTETEAREMIWGDLELPEDYEFNGDVENFKKNFLAGMGNPLGLLTDPKRRSKEHEKILGDYKTMKFVLTEPFSSYDFHYFIGSAMLEKDGSITSLSMNIERTAIYVKNS